MEDKALGCLIVSLIGVALVVAAFVGGMMMVAEAAAALGSDGLSILLVVIVAAGLAFGGVWSAKSWRTMRKDNEWHAIHIEAERRKLNLIRPDHNGLFPVDIDTLRYEPVIMQQWSVALEHQRSRALPGSRTPASMTYSPHVANTSNRQLTAAEDAEIKQLPAIATPENFFQLWSADKLPADKFLMGYDLQDGTEVMADWQRLYSALVGGQSGSGKSTLIRSVLAQSALQGGRFLVIDPHYGAGDESLGASLQPLRHLMIADVASDEKTMIDSLAYMLEMGKRRLSGQDSDHSPVVLVVDETTALLQRSNVAKQLTDVLGQISQETRKVGMYAFCIGQQFHGKIMDTTVRNSFVSMLGCRMRRDVGRTMAGNTEFGQATEKLQIGQAVWLDPQGQMWSLAVPNCTQRDLELVAQHTSGNTYSAALPLVGSSSAASSAASSEVGSTETLMDRVKREKVLAMYLDGLSQNKILSELWDNPSGRAKVQASQEFNDIIRRHIWQLNGNYNG